MTKPRLLLLTSSYPSGDGDERCGYVRGFARRLEASFDVTVVAPPERHESRAEEGGVSLVRSPALLSRAVDPFQAGGDLNDIIRRGFLTRLGVAISLLFFFMSAFRRAWRSDAICSHWLAPAGLIGAVLSRALGKPHVIVEHSGALRWLVRSSGRRWLLRFIVGGADRIVTVSAELKRVLAANCPAAVGKTEVIPMAVEMPVGDDGAVIETGHPPFVLFVGRLVPIKGVEVLLRAARTAERFPIVVAGDGEQRPALERLARELDLDVRFTGLVDARRRDRLLRECSLVVIPSVVLDDGRTEGLPVVCLEAMAAGKPVIASRVGGLPEIVIDGRNGLLFDPGDHLMLAEKMELLLSNQRLRGEIGENARVDAAEYSWSRTGPRFCHILESVLGDHCWGANETELNA
jgi:glycosyltransferase involved in cell wall biosynthesis